jgi:hypothetical protein
LPRGKRTTLHDIVVSSSCYRSWRPVSCMMGVAVRLALAERNPMRSFQLLAVVSTLLVAACNSGPTKNESLQAFAAVTASMASAQSRAVSDAGTGVRAPAVVTLDFSGPCTLGGTVGVTGSYDSSGTGERAAFDMTASYSDCREPTGTIDGSLQWTSVVEGQSFSATMKGGIDFASANGDSFSCDFDLRMGVTATSVTYSGSICGYDVQADLHVAPGA